MLMPAVSPSPENGSSLVLLAPSAEAVPPDFSHVDVDSATHTSLLKSLQRFRGSVYLRDGAVTPAQLSVDGRHVQTADAPSWHVLSLQPDGRVMACARFRVYDASTAPEALGVWSSALARDAEWSVRLRAAVEHEMSLARARGFKYAELGGWAIAEECRCTTHVATTAFSTYALAEALGGCLGVTTATVRHCSSRILRKLGGRSLTTGDLTIPSYFDPNYGCDMEILRFDSTTPGRKYDLYISRMARALRELPVICAAAGRRAAEARRVGHDVLPSLAALAGRHVSCSSPGAFAPA